MHIFLRCMCGASLNRADTKLCTRNSNFFSLEITLKPSSGFYRYEIFYIITEGRNFKTFLKEDYGIAFDSCYMFTKKILNMEFDTMRIVLMEYAYIRHYGLCCCFNEYLAIYLDDEFEKPFSLYVTL